MLKIFLISLFVSVAIALSDKCDKGREICKPDDDYSMMTSVPETEEELDAYCEYMFKILNCMAAVLSECENHTDSERLRVTTSMLTHTCNKETELYRNMLLVLPCIKHEMVGPKAWKCHSMDTDEPTLEKFEKILISAGITDVSRDHECFGKIFHTACSVGRSAAICGAVASDVEMEIAELHFEEIEDECSVKMRGKLPYMAPEMEILYLEAEEVVPSEEEDTNEEEDTSEK